MEDSGITNSRHVVSRRLPQLKGTNPMVLWPRNNSDLQPTEPKPAYKPEPEAAQPKEPKMATKQSEGFSNALRYAAHQAEKRITSLEASIKADQASLADAKLTLDAIHAAQQVLDDAPVTEDLMDEEVENALKSFEEETKDIEIDG